MAHKKPSLASPIAPEDIQRGQYVAILNVIEQYLPCCFSEPGSEPVSIRWRPSFQAQPLKVIDVCLPFVTVQRARGAIITLDVRRHELARLDDAYARRVIKRLRALPTKRSKKR
jgi:hypothetical protein